MFSVCCSEFISVALMFPMFVFVLDFNLKALLSRLACQCVCCFKELLRTDVVGRPSFGGMSADKASGKAPPSNQMIFSRARKDYEPVPGAPICAFIGSTVKR